jgi:hypothetical protein
MAMARTAWCFSLLIGGCDGATTDPIDTGVADTGIADTGIADTGIADTGANDAAPSDAGTGDAGTGMCIDLTVFVDADGDGYGTADMTMMACLLPGEGVPGYSRSSGDCEPADPLAHPNAEGVCNDYVDDNCDASDETCPTTQSVGLDIPSWDCTGTPPTNVYAWARFDDGGGYYQNGGCFLFFEGLADEFYVQHTMVRASSDPSCTQINGCVCPSLNGWPSYDRRIYAYTTDLDLMPCEETYLNDNGNMVQPVSNDCRRYLYQMHFYDIPYNYVSGDVSTLERRLSVYETLEVACIQDRPHANLPYQQLLTTNIERNPGFVKK